MYKLLHPLYMLAGHIICKVILFCCIVRDKLFPPKEKTLLIVAHPDDDTLFFHTAIKEKKPYVALMLTGWSIKRLFDFIKVMKNYGVRFRPYDTVEDKDYTEKRIIKQVKSVFKSGNFNQCLTHNSSGEYGHRNHQLVHKCVIDNVNCEIFVPVSKERIELYPLNTEIVKEKENIFKNFYTTETFVLDEYSIWVKNEKLERYMPDEED